MIDQGSMTLNKINKIVGCASAQEPQGTHKGWSFWFDGYFGAVDNTSAVGRWLARHGDDSSQGIVSVCGGTVQKVQRGQPFDISGVWLEIQDATDHMDLFIRLKNEAYDKLIAFIDALPNG